MDWTKIDRESSLTIEIVRKVLKNNKQKLRSLSLLVPTCVIVILSLIWAYHDYYEAYPARIILAVGLEFFLVSVKMILYVMCKVYTVDPHV